jgi:hypothetical protein
MREMSKAKTGNGSPRRSTRSKVHPALPLAGRVRPHGEPEVADPPEGPPKTHVVQVGTTAASVTLTQSAATIPATAKFVRWDFGGLTGSVVLKSASTLVKDLRPHKKGGQVADIFSTAPGSYEFEVTVHKGTTTLKGAGFLVI